jgi:hypothetical protein
MSPVVALRDILQCRASERPRGPRRRVVPSFCPRCVRIDPCSVSSGIAKRGVQKAGNSNEKDNRECLSLFSVDVFGNDGQRPRGQHCVWGHLEDRSCGSHAHSSHSQTVHRAFSRLEPTKRHPAGTESYRGGPNLACERQSACTAEPD